jgi:hypothetical protein
LCRRVRRGVSWVGVMGGRVGGGGRLGGRPLAPRGAARRGCASTRPHPRPVACMRAPPCRRRAHVPAAPPTSATCWRPAGPPPASPTPRAPPSVLRGAGQGRAATRGGANGWMGGRLAPHPARGEATHGGWAGCGGGGLSVVWQVRVDGGGRVLTRSQLGSWGGSALSSFFFFPLPPLAFLGGLRDARAGRGGLRAKPRPCAHAHRTRTRLGIPRRLGLWIVAPSLARPIHWTHWRHPLDPHQPPRPHMFPLAQPLRAQLRSSFARPRAGRRARELGGSVAWSRKPSWLPRLLTEQVVVERLWWWRRAAVRRILHCSSAGHLHI